LRGPSQELAGAILTSAQWDKETYGEEEGAIAGLRDTVGSHCELCGRDVFRELLGGRAVVVQRKTSLGEGLGDFLMVPT
jgi:hypothetical protein